MFRLAPYVLRSLWRHRMRSGLTVSGAAVALAVFCFVGSIHQGLRSLTDGAEADRSLIVYQENRFCPVSSRLPQDYQQTIEKIDGVDQVLPISVYTNNCRVSLDAIVFYGMRANQLRAARQIELIEGDWSTFLSRQDAALVGRSVARRPQRNIQVGRSFSIGKVTVHVAGIFRATPASEESLIYTHLEFLERTAGVNAVGVVTEFEVRLAGGADPDRVSAAIDEAFRSGPVATATRRKGVFQAGTLGDLIDLIGFARWLGYAAVGLVLSIVATTTVMAVQDRAGEHALLKTLGVRPGRVFRLVVAESVLLCVVGGLIGTGVALVVLGTGGLAVAAEGVTVAFQPSWRLGAVGVGLSALLGVVAGIVPAWHAARTRIVAALGRTV